MSVVLSQDDLDFWEENGFVVIHNAVPDENLEVAVNAIWDFLGIDAHDPEHWYKYPPRIGGRNNSPISQAGIVEIYQHQEALHLVEITSEAFQVEEQHQVLQML